MRFCALLGASFTAGALAISFARPATAEILIRVDKETQTMTVTVDRLVTYVWPVSTGMEGRDTPSGTFQPNRMDADHHSQEWDNAPMPHTIFFDMHGHAVHGFASITHLGNPASHGCVRLAPQNAALLFDLVKMEKMHDTTVVITGKTPSLQSLAALRRHDMIAANAPLTRESLAHRSADQAPPYRDETTTYIKETAVYQPPQALASEQLIATPTFAMSGARWTRRPSIVQAAYVVPAPPVAPQPLPHAADRQQHEPAVSARRPKAAEIRTAINEQPAADFESLQVEAPQQPAASEQPQPQPHATEVQEHRPSTRGRHQAPSGLETAVNEQPAEGEPLEVQPPKPAAAVSDQSPAVYHRLQAYAQPPVMPPSARLPSGYRQQQQAQAYAQPYSYRQAGAYGPRLYYVLPPTGGQHVYYYVQPGYAQPGYPQPQYYQLYGQY
jgi:hypothetical protein